MQSTKILHKENYPYLLKQISRLPEQMDIIGDLPSDENKFLCVIGSRRYNEYGDAVCKKLIHGLAGYPIIIVSGLAIGIDSIAHQSALDVGLKTIAFPGSGLAPNVLYPQNRRNLAEKIVESGGALISPFEFNQIGAPWTFPTRNRLIAGISHATLIIEAGQGSGTLLTAEYALQFNRDVLAVPGSIESELSYGPHMLIKRGAVPITSSRDILEALGFALTNKNIEQKSINFEQINLSPEERKVAEEICRAPINSSDLIEKTGFNSSALNIILSTLEIRGLIIESDGLYRLN